MPTLSLAMIVRDEAACLGRCLGSVRGLVDELVVVDTGSADGTVAIAEAAGARIGRFPWRDDFAAARNESLRLCTGDWVLLLDADEAVEDRDHDAIRRAIRTAKVAGFTLVSRNYVREAGARLFDKPVVPNRSSYRLGAEFPFYADQPMLRLVRRLPGLAFEGRIHERLDPCLRRRNLQVGNLGAVIHHFGKLDADRERAKSAYYLDLAEREAVDHPDDPDRQFNLMAQAEVAERWETALAAGEAVLRHSRTVPYAVHATLALACQNLGRHPEALAHLERILAVHPGHALARRRLARSLAALGRVDEARAWLERELAEAPEDPEPCLELCDLEQGLGRAVPARRALGAAVARRPGDARLRQALVELDLRQGQEAQAAADALEALRALPGEGGGHWHALAAGFLLKEGHVRPGRAVLDLGLAQFPDHPALRGLAAALAAAGEGG
jgi:tetratricopeptide (TPR) repeat protein